MGPGCHGTEGLFQALPQGLGAPAVPDRRAYWTGGLALAAAASVAAAAFPLWRRRPGARDAVPHPGEADSVALLVA